MRLTLIKNCRGQAMVEASIVIVFMIPVILAMASAMWLGWMRLELGQIVQVVGACRNSTRAQLCRRDLETTLSKYPGNWSARRISDQQDRTQVDFYYRIGRREIRWSIDEPKAFQLGR